MNTFTLTSYGEELTLTVEFAAYANGRTALSLLYWDKEMDGWFPHARITVNLPDQHLNEGEVFVKDWAENEEIVDYMTEQGWLIPTGREVVSGFVAPAVMRLAGPLLEGDLMCAHCRDAVTREGDELVGSDGEVCCPESDRPHGPAVPDTEVGQ